MLVSEGGCLVLYKIFLPCLHRWSERGVGAQKPHDPFLTFLTLSSQTKEKRRFFSKVDHLLLYYVSLEFCHLAFKYSTAQRRALTYQACECSCVLYGGVAAPFTPLRDILFTPLWADLKRNKKRETG